jgi:hypothetical protein
MADENTPFFGIFSDNCATKRLVIKLVDGK